MSSVTAPPNGAPAPEIGTQGAFLVLGAVSIIVFLLIGSTLASLAVYLPALQADFGWPEQDLGAIAASMLVGMSVASIAAGWILTKIGPRNLMATGVVITAAGLLSAAHATNLLQLAGAMAAIGAGIGTATIIPGATVINRWFVRDRGIPMAVFIGAIVIASAIMPLFSELLIQATGWRSAFSISAGMIAVMCLSLCALVRLPPDRKLLCSQIVAPGDELHLGAGLTVREGLRYPRFWLLALALTLVQLSINGILYNVVSYLIGEGYSSGKAVSIYSIANLCGLPGLFICGMLSDRFGAHRIIPFSALILAIGTFSLLAVEIHGTFSPVALAAFIILWGTASGIPSQIGPIILAELVGMRAFPTLMGIKAAVISLVGALAPILTGALFALGGSYHLPFLVSGLLAVIAAPLFGFVRRIPCDNDDGAVAALIASKVGEASIHE